MPVLFDTPTYRYFGVLRVLPIIEGEDADPDYLLRFVEAAVLPTLGLA
ncbi:hypothetical protein ACFYOV_31470 [Streptomyces sp. NPDC005931]